MMQDLMTDALSVLVLDIIVSGNSGEWAQTYVRVTV